MIPKTKFNPPQHLCAYFHVSSFILDIVLRYPDIPCRSLGGLFFHVYPNIIIDNGTKTEGCSYEIWNYGGVAVHKTILIEEITIENVTEKINEKVQEMEKDGYQIKTMSFWGTDKVVLIFKKGLKGSFL